MFIVGMGTLLGMFEAVLTAIEDEFPICRKVTWIVFFWSFFPIN